MKSSVEIYNRIIEAAEKGKGVRLSHQECQTVASDQAIIDAVMANGATNTRDEMEDLIEHDGVRRDG